MLVRRPLRSTTRSPSPAHIQTAGKGIQAVKRKVIRRLSNLGTPAPTLDTNMKDGMNGGLTTANEINELSRMDNTTHNGAVNKVEKAVKAPIDWEIPRKSLHSSIGFLTVYLYMSDGSPTLVIYSLVTALAIIVPADILRLNHKGFAAFYEKQLGALMRESEKNSSNGVIWYIIGVTFALYYYPLDVATVAILILSWADTAASTIGRLWGSKTPPLPSRFLGLPFAPRKSLAGFLAATVTGALIAAGFWGYMAPIRPLDCSWTWEGGVAPALMEGTLTQGAKAYVEGVRGSVGGKFDGAGWLGLSLIAVVAGLAAGVVEALDVGSLDDNLTLPILSGGIIFGFFKLLGLFS